MPSNAPIRSLQNPWHPTLDHLLRDRRASLKNVRLLLVDDDADTREALAAVLSSYQSDVRVAASAADALATLRAWRPDVLVSDVSLPGEDGYALIRNVRALGSDDGGRTPAIALTGFSRTQDRIRLISAGFQMHVAKPVDLTELIAVVASLVRDTPRATSTAAGSTDAAALDIDATAADEAPVAIETMTLSHELRQPLFAMRLWLKLLDSEMADTITEEGRSYVAHVRASIAAMEEIIRRTVDGVR